MNPIYDVLQMKYHTLYGRTPKETSLEYQILKEVTELKTKLSIKEALLFSDMLVQMDYIYASKEQKLWKNFVFCHLVYLFGKKMFAFNIHLLTMICDSITKENIKKDFRYLMLLSDEKWIKKLYEQVLFTDFSFSFGNHYQIEFDRIQKLFLNLCQKIEEILKEIPKETDVEMMKKEVFKKVKNNFQSSYLKGV